jgi:hypothetical protein
MLHGKHVKNNTKEHPIGTIATLDGRVRPAAEVELDLFVLEEDSPPPHSKRGRTSPHRSGGGRGPGYRVRVDATKVSTDEATDRAIYAVYRAVKHVVCGKL